MNVLVRFDSADDTGIDQLRDAADTLPEPIDVSVAQRDIGGAQLRMDLLGDTTVGSVRYAGHSSIHVRRTPSLIRRSDPGFVCLAMPVVGLTRVSQDRDEATLRPGQMALYDTSRPYVGGCRPGAGELIAEVVILGVPRDRLPVRPKRLRDLSARLLPVPPPIGRLFMSCLSQVSKDAGEYSPAMAASAAGVTADLLGAVLAAAQDAQRPLEPEARCRLLSMQAKAFIDANLRDPALSPAMIAAAHHVSLRTLYRAFEEQGKPITQWIRRRRLDRCRRDLVDPTLALRPVHVVAAGWGFPNAAVFSRVFRNEFGLPPQAYRQRHLSPGSDGVKPLSRPRAGGD